MKCNNCGFNNVEDAVFCEKCGIKMVDDKPEMSLEALKKAIADFSKAEKRILLTCLILIIAAPALCGIINKIDSVAEKKAYEKEHSMSSSIAYQETTSTNELKENNYSGAYVAEEMQPTQPSKAMSGLDFAKEVAYTLVNRDVDKFYSYINTSSEEVKYLLDKNIMKSVMDFIFADCSFDGNLTKTDYSSWTFDGGDVEEYQFNAVKSDGTVQPICIHVISYDDRNVLDISDSIKTEEFTLPCCAEVSILGNKLTGELQSEEDNQKVYNKYTISYLNFAERLPVTIYIPGMSRPVDFVFDDYIYGISMYSVSSLDKAGECFDEKLVKTIPHSILQTMVGNTAPSEQYAFPADIQKDDTIALGEAFGNNIYGDMYYRLSGDADNAFKEIKDYSISDYDVREDGYLYLEVDVEYVYTYTSFDEIVEDSNYATFRYKYINNQWYLTASDGSISEGV